MTDRFVKGLRDANQSLRQVARGLVPLQVDAHGLNYALTNLANQISESYIIACRCLVDDTVDVDNGSAATHLYRIAQEAVNNSLKHGLAHEIEIRLRHRDRVVDLQIADDGIGINGMSQTQGRGLQIMAYRAGLIGAILTVRQGEPRGTVASCSWPCS